MAMGNTILVKEEGEGVQVIEEDAPQVIIVDWDGDDKEDMKRASNLRKYAIVLFLVSCAFQTIALSSAWSIASQSIQDHFHASHEVVVLGISLYVFALATGPMITAPLSETFGRRPLYLVGYALFLAFQFLTAFAPNIGAMLVGRAIAAFFGAVSVSNTGGTIADLFGKKDMGIPMAIFAVGPFIGPGVGPVIAGFIDVSVNFRWIFYVFIIWSGVNLAILCFIPETYPPVLKSKKAKRLRKEKGNDSFRSAREIASLGVWELVRQNCTKPFEIFIFDPIMTLLCTYCGFTLAIVYFFFVAFPIVFEDVYGFTVQYVGLSFLGYTIGMLLSSASYPLWEKYRQHQIATNGGVSEPEMRLPQMAVGAVLLPVSLFWFAWTIYPSIHWMSPVLASTLFGMACFCLFNSIISYTIETYKLNAASAMASNVFVRCIFAGAFPLFGKQMLIGMGYHWAISLIGFVSVLLLPSPFLFLKYGRTLRAKSKYSA
ncbi:probable drug/proton antiporter Yhk8p [Trichomonascus vanleenenianus]|uniref:MFS transporter n=1 Tax=Trichomonascus vanleenenianus TaxID=2268995 RepID=UPI003ECA8445